MNRMIANHPTPLGTMWSTWTTRGLYRLNWTEPEFASEFKSEFSEAAELDQRLKSFFRGEPGCFRDLEIDGDGWTDFTREIYQCCRRIDCGTTITYQQLAAMAGREKASRAVGTAMSRNRVLLVIPCHRVIAADGSLRGFSAPGGLETKRKLLQIESSALSQLAI